jgi:hypothetical protein
MTVEELITELLEYPIDSEVTIVKRPEGDEWTSEYYDFSVRDDKDGNIVLEQKGQYIRTKLCLYGEV